MPVISLPVRYSGKSCHQTIYAEWMQSDHYHAMQIADAGSVLGDFNNGTVEFHGMEIRLYQSDGDYFVKIPGPDGVYGDYRVLYTFGFYPLQQYLVATTKGRLQAFKCGLGCQVQGRGAARDGFTCSRMKTSRRIIRFFWTGFFFQLEQQLCRLSQYRHSQGI